MRSCGSEKPVCEIQVPSHWLSLCSSLCLKEAWEVILHSFSTYTVVWLIPSTPVSHSLQSHAVRGSLIAYLKAFSNSSISDAVYTQTITVSSNWPWLRPHRCVGHRCLLIPSLHSSQLFLLPSCLDPLPFCQSLEKNLLLFTHSLQKSSFLSSTLLLVNPTLSSEPEDHILNSV